MRFDLMLTELDYLVSRKPAILEDATDVGFACFDVYLGCVSTHSRRRGDSASEVEKMSFWSWWKSERFEEFRNFALCVVFSPLLHFLIFFGFTASNKGGYGGKLMHQNFA
ncbi:hypothetical protein TNCV_4968881 [Trichonephila clavipes]|nr:hypothetical protein TNCV_4968881 [Trichonephila clavipes]